MAAQATRVEGTPPPFTDVEDVFLYGVDLDPPPLAWPHDQERQQRVLVYSFCYQGHCYKLSIPAEYHFKSYNRRAAVGCGFSGVRGYSMWQVEKTTKIKRVERRGGTVEELILEINLPGQNPASLTYSAKVAIASNAGKIYE